MSFVSLVSYIDTKTVVLDQFLGISHEDYHAVYLLRCSWINVLIILEGNEVTMLMLHLFEAPRNPTELPHLRKPAPPQDRSDLSSYSYTMKMFGII